MYRFVLPIGDWSGDGHNDCQNFTINSNVSVEELREIYLTTKEQVGFGLDGSKAPCSEYNDTQISKEDILNLGLNPLNYFEDESHLDLGTIEVEMFAQLFLDFIMVHNPQINLNIEPNLEMFPFYKDKQNHIYSIGYGLFVN